MASKKDMRREDLAIPYASKDVEKKETDYASTMSSTMPMAAMFTRNKMIGWTAMVFAVQSWLSETSEQKKNPDRTPAYLGVGMSLMAVAMCYLPLFMPPPPISGGTGTEAPAAAPSS